MNEQDAIHAVVSGRVQGVAFRACTRDEARSLGLSGWVRNRSDGSVELKAWGAPSALASFQQWLRRGPPLARVDALECEAAEPDSGSGFQIRY